MDKVRIFVWRRHTTVLSIIGLVLVLVGLAVSFMVTHFQPTTQVKLGSGVFSLTLANTEAARVQGLSGTSSLDPNGGMLFDFGIDDTHGIWMKNMNYPLDIVWLDSSKKVVYIVMNAQPEAPATTVYSPKSNARYVIELPAGTVKKSGIKTGNIAEFELDV